MSYGTIAGANDLGDEVAEWKLSGRTVREEKESSGSGMLQVLETPSRRFQMDCKGES